MVLNVLAGPHERPPFGAIFNLLGDPIRHGQSSTRRPSVQFRRVARDGKLGSRQSRRSVDRTRRRTRKVPAYREGGRPDAPTRPLGKTRCKGRGGITRTRSATWALRPATGGRHPEKRRARWSLLRGPLRGLMRPGLFIPWPGAEDAPPRAAN